MRAVAKVLPQSSHVFGFGGLPSFFFMGVLYKRCVGNASTLYELFLQVAPQREAGRHKAAHSILKRGPCGGDEGAGFGAGPRHWYNEFKPRQFTDTLS
jgi:hypothetical protein